MAVSVRSATAETAEASPVTPSKPAGTVSGDLLIAIHGQDSTGTLGGMGAPTGWSLVGEDSRTGVGFVKVWTRVAGGSEPGSYAFTDSATSDSSVAIIAVTGQDPDTPLAVNPVFTGSASSTTAHDAPSVTGVADGLLVTGHFAGGATNATRTYTPPSGMTEEVETNVAERTALEVASLALASSAGTGTKTATCSTSTPYTALSLVVNPVGGGPGGGAGVVDFVAADEDARGTTNAPVVPRPAGATTGDLLLAFQVSDHRGSLAAMTADAGWTQVASNTTRSGDVGYIKIWQKTATGAEPADYTFPDSTAATSVAVVVALTGWDVTDALAVDPTWNSGTSQTTHVASTVNGVVDGMLLTAHIAGTNGTTRQYTGTPSGMTLAQDAYLSTSGYVTANVYYQALTATGATGAKIATLSASAPFVAVSLVVQPPAAKTVSPSGIASAAAFGSPVVVVDPPPQTVSPSGIGTAEAFGTSTVTVATADQTVSPTGIVTAEAVGSPSVTVDLADQTVTAVGITSGEAFGSPEVSLPPVLSPVGIVSAEVFGSPLVTGGAGFGIAGFGTSEFGTGAAGQTVIAVGIVSAEAIGSPEVAGEPLVLPSGIVTAEAFGSPAVAVDLSDQTVTAVGITSAEVFGVPDMLPEQLIVPDGIASDEALGSPVVDDGLTTLTVVGIGIDSAEVFGFPTLTVPPNLPNLYPSVLLYPGSGVFPGTAQPDAAAQTVAPTGVASAETFGAPIVTLAAGDQTVRATPIDSDEAFGVPTVAADDPEFTISPTGIGSAEAFGSPAQTLVYVEVPPPVPTGVDSYYIDGVDLGGFAWRIETAEGLQSTPGVIGEDPVLPGRDGALEVYGGFGQQRRPDGIGQIVFSLWLKGVSASTGLVPGGSDTMTEYFARWDELVRLFHRRRVTIDHVKADGSIRRAIAHLAPGDSIGPSRAPSSPWFGRFKATFAIPAAHWTDTDTVTTGQQSLTTGGSLSLAAFAGATAVCTELTVVFGAGNNPRLSTAWGHVGWNNVISAGRQLGIDTVTGTTNSAAGTGWTPGYDALSFAPGPRLFEVDPSEALTATLTHTGGGSMTVQVTGKRRYRTS